MADRPGTSRAHSSLSQDENDDRRSHNSEADHIMTLNLNNHLLKQYTAKENKKQRSFYEQDENGRQRSRRDSDESWRGRDENSLADSMEYEEDRRNYSQPNYSNNRRLAINPSAQSVQEDDLGDGSVVVPPSTPVKSSNLSVNHDRRSTSTEKEDLCMSNTHVTHLLLIAVLVCVIYIIVNDHESAKTSQKKFMKLEKTISKLEGSLEAYINQNRTLD